MYFFHQNKNKKQQQQKKTPPNIGHIFWMVSDKSFKILMWVRCDKYKYFWPRKLTFLKAFNTDC
jgi:hypothetical protein